MEFVHRCHFCDSEREAGSPTILRPHCEGCGSLLDSGRREDFAPELTVELGFPRRIHLSSKAARAVRVGAFASVLFTAATAGFQSGGPWLALGAFGAAGLAVTPALIRG
jgi:hypothetical protein